MSWAERHRGRAPAPAAPSAGKAAARVVRPLAKAFGPGIAELDAHWAAIVGDQLARWTRPERFQGGAAGSTLVIRARGPAGALAEAQSARILERVAHYSGRSPTRLKVIQGALSDARPSAEAPRVRRVRAAPEHEALASDPSARLEAVLEAWAAAVAEREGVDVGPSKQRK
ncbi:DUF721 domain-containing protein [Marinicauda salina]|nr:DUF721 domain-containing protein [Marinicauda salina]